MSHTPIDVSVFGAVSNKKSKSEVYTSENVSLDKNSHNFKFKVRIYHRRGSSLGPLAQKPIIFQATFSDKIITIK